jgi:hypothetical protein
MALLFGNLASSMFSPYLYLAGFNYFYYYAIYFNLSFTAIPHFLPICAWLFWNVFVKEKFIRAIIIKKEKKKGGEKKGGMWETKQKRNKTIYQ